MAREVRVWRVNLQRITFQGKRDHSQHNLAMVRRQVDESTLCCNLNQTPSWRLISYGFVADYDVLYKSAFVLPSGVGPSLWSHLI